MGTARRCLGLALARAYFGRVTRHEKLCHQPGPAGLVGGTDATTRVAVEVLVEKHAVPEVRIGLCALVEAMNRPAPVPIRKEQATQADGDLVGNFVERRKLSRACWAFDAELIPVVVVELLQRLYDEEVDRKPNRPAPVGVAPEQPAVGLG